MLRRSTNRLSLSVNRAKVPSLASRITAPWDLCAFDRAASIRWSRPGVSTNLRTGPSQIDLNENVPVTRLTKKACNPFRLRAECVQLN